MSQFVRWFSDLGIADGSKLVASLVKRGSDSISLNPDAVRKASATIPRKAHAIKTKAFHALESTTRGLRD